MKHRIDGTAWVVFFDGIQELARISADEATSEEIDEARDLLAYEYNCHPDEIEFRLEVNPFAGAFASSTEE